MGGILILFAISIAALLWTRLDNVYFWVVLLVMLDFGVIGWLDDHLKLVLNNPRGLSSRWKYFWQSLISIIAAGVL